MSEVCPGGTLHQVGTAVLMNPMQYDSICMQVQNREKQRQFGGFR